MHKHIYIAWKLVQVIHNFNSHIELSVMHTSWMRSNWKLVLRLVSKWLEIPRTTDCLLQRTAPHVYQTKIKLACGSGFRLLPYYTLCMIPDCTSHGQTTWGSISDFRAVTMIDPVQINALQRCHWVLSYTYINRDSCFGEWDSFLEGKLWLYSIGTEQQTPPGDLFPVLPTVTFSHKVKWHS